jgi:hypothetical protein
MPAKYFAGICLTEGALKVFFANKHHGSRNSLPILPLVCSKKLKGLTFQVVCTVENFPKPSLYFIQTAMIKSCHESLVSFILFADRSIHCLFHDDDTDSFCATGSNRAFWERSVSG